MSEPLGYESAAITLSGEIEWKFDNELKSIAWDIAKSRGCSTVTAGHIVEAIPEALRRLP